MKQSLIINCDRSLAENIHRINQYYAQHGWLRIDVDTNKQRSSKQNRSLHLYCAMLASAMNESGQHLIIIVNQKQTEINWNCETVKELIWRPIQKAVTQQKSSTKCSTADYPVIYEHLNRYTTEKLGIYVPWPSEFTNENR